MKKPPRYSDEEFRDKLFFEHEERKKAEKSLKKLKKPELELFTYGRKGASGENPNQLLTTPEERLLLFRALIPLLKGPSFDKGLAFEEILERHGFIGHCQERGHPSMSLETTPEERKETMMLLQTLYGRYCREVTEASNKRERIKDRRDRDARFADAFEKLIHRRGYIRHVRSRMRDGQIT